LVTQFMADNDNDAVSGREVRLRAQGATTVFLRALFLKDAAAP